MRMLGEKGRIAEKQARYREKTRYGSVTVALPVTGANPLTLPLTLNCFTSSVVTRPDTDGNVTVTLPGHLEVDAPAKPPKSRGSRIAADWLPSPAVYRRAATEGMSNGQVDAEIGSFIDFWIAIPGAEGVKADWDATFRNRLRES